MAMLLLGLDNIPEQTLAHYIHQLWRYGSRLLQDVQQFMTPLICGSSTLTMELRA